MPSFDAVLEHGPGGGAYVVVPDEVVAELGGRARTRVRGRFGGVELRSALAPLGGGRMGVGVHKAVRLAAGVDFGAAAAVELDRDERPVALELPPELAELLDPDERLRAAFDAAAPSRRREWVAQVRDARRPETRLRRAARIAEQLRGTPGAERR